jgi:hypothetical protein
VVARPWLTGRVSAAVLVRKLATAAPTLLLDETDAAFRGNPEYAETLRGVLNNGYRRSGVVSLCLKHGGEIELADLPVFGAKALAGLGRLPDTVRDRSIDIGLRRRAASETVRRFRRREAEVVAEPLRRVCAAWARSVGDTPGDARPAIPDCLDDRAQDSWEPMLAIADLAGEGWLRRAEHAAIALSTGVAREDESRGVALLRDTRAVFADVSGDAMFTADLVAALIRIDESPWGDIDGRGRELDGRRLAALLKPFGIRSKQVRVGATTKKGYRREDFIDAWNRYLPGSAAEGETGETRETESASAHENGADGVSDNEASTETVSGDASPEDESDETLKASAQERNGHYTSDVSDVSHVSPFTDADERKRDLGRIAVWALDHGGASLRLADGREIGGSPENWNRFAESATQHEIRAALEAIQFAESA